MDRVTVPSHKNNPATIEADARLGFVEVPDAVVLDLLRSFGVVLFRGGALTLDDFVLLTDRFGANYRKNTAGDRDVVGGDVQTVNLGRAAFALHPEMSTTPDKPELAWFGCAQSSQGGGATLLADGIEIASALPEDVLNVCNARQLRYRRLLDANKVEHQQVGFRYSRVGNLVIRDYIAPILHRPKFQPQSPAWGNFILFARYTRRDYAYPTFDDGSTIPDDFCDAVRSVADRHTVAHEWKSGDVLMVDNSRFLHGRPQLTSQQQAERTIWTRFGFLRD